MALERASFMQKLRKGLSYMVNRKVAVGFGSWRASLAGRPSDDPMAKALSYFLNRNLARGWEGWQALYEEKRRKMESMRKSMGHMLNRQLSRGHGAWLQMVLERAE